MKKQRSKKGETLGTKTKKRVFSKKHAAKVKNILLETIISNI